MIFKRGDKSVEVELANVQSCLEAITPTIEEHGGRLSDLEDFRSNTDGKFTVIVWIVGVNITILLATLGAFIDWASRHVTFAF